MLAYFASQIYLKHEFLIVVGLEETLLAILDDVASNEEDSTSIYRRNYLVNIPLQLCFPASTAEAGGGGGNGVDSREGLA